MTRAELEKSLAVWEEREDRFRANYRGYVHSQDPAKRKSPRRAYWYGQLVNAKKMVDRREAQLKKLGPGVITRTDEKGRTFLENQEGSIPYVYNDSAGHATFGIGHLVHLGAFTPADQRKWGSKSNPKPQLVDPTFKDDLRKYETAVRNATKGSKIHVNQQMFNAMVSLCYNIGTGGFASSSVAKYVRQGRKRDAANAFFMWVHPEELRGRRGREAKLFLS